MTEACFTPLSARVDTRHSSRLETLFEQARRTLASDDVGPEDWVQLTLAAPVIPIAPLSTWGSESVVWNPSPEQQYVGIDCAACYPGEGESRFLTVQRTASHALCRVHDWTEAGAVAQRPRVFGGFSFAVAPSSPHWREFGSARFVLPRHGYEVNGEQATLSVRLRANEVEAREPARRHLLEHLSLLAWLHEARVKDFSVSQAQRLSSRARPPRSVVEMSRTEWSALVSEILTAIERGELSKVVLARQSELRFDHLLDLEGTLEALQHSHSTSTCFCFRIADRAFVGATPERLVRREQLAIESEALAGTFRRGSTEFAAELLRSPKEHSEHAPVLTAIVDVLAPLCRSLQYSENPEMRELPQMLHLRTPVLGELKKPVHILELVARLHPTPAVGGVPTERALGWLSEREPLDRGWYGAPIGWFDRDGNGEFCVALRSGLLHGTTAHLFAGGGIVRGSHPDSEYDETQLKLQVMYASLRVGHRV